MIRQVFRLRMNLEKFKDGFLGEKCQIPESTQFLVRQGEQLTRQGDCFFPELAIASKGSRLASPCETEHLVRLNVTFVARVDVS
ncbi:hypothetical protein MtrunA17_Chr1g0167861 [Medicago truncatula]|uniref:Uncharacterized protein n=1 Tax=Medicago truncatula TaxID=3880 RepID=G7I5G3_MEDTR|nr:hypothetical protein MTR_1g043610 [Medicago truncatula]RHN78615.1 hypothetical protein MtrunA17_Chr1g0167861 [Medicago truncatula]